MRPPLWFVVLAWAEIVFVTTFLVVEAVRYVLGPRIARAERVLHKLPDDRYFTYFFVPAATILSGIAISVGVNLSTDQDQSALGSWVGQMLVVASVVVFLTYCGKHAARRYPRPVSRARRRRALAVAAETLASDAPISEPEVVQLRARLMRLGRLGDLLVARANSLRWRDAVRTESRWLLVAAVAAGCIPVAAVVWVGLRTAMGAESNEVVPTVTLHLGLAATVALAMFLRFNRYRRELRSFGIELAVDSRALLDRLVHVVETTGRAGSSQATMSLLPALWAVFRSWRRQRQPRPLLPSEDPGGRRVLHRRR